MTPQERHAYDEHLSAVMIQNDVLDTAKLEGRIEGRAEGRAEEKLLIAKNLKAIGLPTESIVQATGLSASEIEQI